MKLILCACALILSLAETLGQLPPDYDWDTTTRLDEYVNRDDGAFNWELLDVYEYNTSMVYILNMTSQKWLNESMVTRSEWWHVMGVAIPNEPVLLDTAFFFIDGGTNDPDDIPGPASYFNVLATQFANDTGCVAGWMKQVPNQPVVFADDPEQRTRREDDIIAFSWWWILQYTKDGLEPPSYDIVLRNPMTRAAKRGLDATAELAQSIVPEFNINKFVVSGASKRGWTAWSIAATDQRVVATAPLVMSLLYGEETFMAHYRTMDAGWSWAFTPYYRQNLTYYLLEPAAAPLFDIEDMFRYRSRLAMIPKLMTSATGDEFFLNQDSHFWWDYMGGTKHIMMNPNCEHILFPQWIKIYDTISTWFQIIMYEGEQALPSVTWKREQIGNSSGRITLTANPPPAVIQGHSAVTIENSTLREYRFFTGPGMGEPPVFQPIFWYDTEVQTVNETTFVMEVDTVEDEWVAFFIEGLWDSPYLPRQMRLTSEVQISPDTFPAEPCTTPEECYGELK